ncbi:trimeric intracellular cation channel family protein [Bhargavaea ullalensis]|uniref:Membrane protein YeiH n=1 Tax=Bhargavaea ullalensis TaxID=1265685 RepID=A0ABV2GDR1_9BACL
MAWEVLSMIGTVAFAVSGAVIAMEEEYDLFGVYMLGVVTAFGGGAFRNVLIGVPVSALWEQEMLFRIALVSITVIFLFPNRLIRHWSRWGTSFDAVGLAAFAVQGAMMAVQLGLGMSATIVAAVLTGAGGGMIRDLLAGRRPLVLRKEIYAVWAAIAGIAVTLGAGMADWGLYLVAATVAVLRIFSARFGWRLPVRKLVS